MLQLLSLDDCRRLTDFFASAGYTFEALSAARLPQRASHRYGTVRFLVEKTAGPSTFHTLVHWFAIGVPVPVETAARQVPAWAIDLLVNSGMLSSAAGQLLPAVMLSPLGSILVASDPVLKWEDDPADLVLWPNPTTKQLLYFTIRKPFRAALDLGCGCGIQALAAASHCETVMATDLNPRAAEFSRFNARLNGISNLECTTGDLFEPLAARTFDLIVANPPFFITPGSSLMYCENSQELDLFCRRLAREAPPHLNESGYFQMLCEWVEIEGQPWRDRVSEWFDSTACDAWLIRQYTRDADAYGADRASQRPPASDSENRDFLADWAAYVHQQKIAAVHGGLLTMRKRSGTNWVRIDDQPVSLQAPVGDLILAAFEMRDLLAAPDDALMDRCPRLVESAELVRLFGPSPQGWSPRSLRLRLTGPRPAQIDLDPLVAQFLGRCNGSSRLRDLILDLAGHTTAPAERVADECIAVVRNLLAEGFLQL